MSAPRLIPLLPAHEEGVFALAIILAVLYTLALSCRFWSRAILPGKRYGADDWMALAAWPLAVCMTIETCLLMRYGFGRHIGEVLEIAPANLAFTLQVLYAGYLTYIAVMALLRISAGLFYGRLFSNASNSFRWLVHVNTVLNIMMLVGLGLVAALECLPVAAFWDKTITGATCLPILNVQLGSGVPSVVLDLYVLIIPLPVIWRLHMNLRKKMLLVITFVLGYSVIVFSLGRLITIVKIRDLIATDVTWNFPVLLIWLNLEMSVTAICISIPSCFPMIRRAREGGIRALFRRQPLLSQLRSKGVRNGRSAYAVGKGDTYLLNDVDVRTELGPCKPPAVFRRDIGIAIDTTSSCTSLRPGDSSLDE